MNITNVRWESTKSLNYKINYRKEKQKSNNEFSINYCSENIKQLIDWYENFEFLYQEQKYIEACKNLQQRKINAINTEKIINDVINGKNHLCTCGSKLRYIENYNFVGCTNYKNKSIKHDSYNYPNWELINSNNNINTEDFKLTGDHLSNYKLFFNIPKEVKTSVIFKFLKANNVKFHVEINESKFNLLPQEKRNSSNEELIIKNILEQKYKKVNYQSGIEYQLDNIEKWNSCIPDFICQNDTEIVVFEVKKSIENVYYNQLDLYHNLIDILKTKSNINKVVKSYFIIFTPFTGGYNKCLTINNLKNL